MSRRVYVRLSKVNHLANEPFVDGWAWDNAFDATLNLVDLSRIIDSFRLGIVTPHMFEAWLLKRGEEVPAADAKPAMRISLSTWDALKAAAKGFDAGLAATRRKP